MGRLKRIIKLFILSVRAAVVVERTEIESQRENLQISDKVVPRMPDVKFDRSKKAFPFYIVVEEASSFNLLSMLLDSIRSPTSY